MTRCYQLSTKGFVFSTILFKGNILNISAFLSRSQTCINKRFCQGKKRKLFLLFFTYQIQLQTFESLFITFFPGFVFLVLAVSC